MRNIARGGLLAALTTMAVAGTAITAPMASAATASGSSNEQIAFDYFLGKGLTNYQAAGIIGNFVQESGVSPTAHQYPSGPGRGIAQWEVGGRWDTNSGDNMLTYATSIGESATSLDAQLKFTWYELTTRSGYGLSALRATTNVTAATRVFMADFEGCSVCVLGHRESAAVAALDAYGHDSVTTSAGSWHGALQQTGAGHIASTPSAVINGTTSFVFWKGTDGALWESTGSPSGSLGTATKVPGTGTLGSAPSAAVTSAGYTSVYWQGTDGHLWSAYWNQGWHTVKNTSADTIGSAPSAVINGNTVYVFWKGTDGALWEAQATPTGTLGAATKVPGTGTLGSGPSAAVTHQGLTTVYWKGTDGHLWSAYYNQGWHTIEHPDAGTIGSAPSAVIGAAGQTYVFWKGTDGNLWEAQGTPDLPLSQISKIPNTGTLGSGPSVAVNSQGYTSVYWQGTNNSLYESYWA